MSEKPKDDKDTFSQLAEDLPSIKEDEQVDVDEPTYDELQKQVETLEAKVQENHNKYLRAAADKDNFRKRMEREIDGARKYAVESIIKELLPILDSMEQGLSIAGKDNEETIKSMHEGMLMTMKMFQDLLAKFGVEILHPEGEKFDPHLHEAMSMVEDDKAKSNTVIQVIQKGYTLHGRVVRPARVIVCK